MRSVAVVGIARHAARARQAFLMRGGDRGLHAEVVRLARLPLGDALGLGGVQAIELVLVTLLLRQQAFDFRQQFTAALLALRTTAVGRVDNGLLLHGAVDDHFLEALALDHLRRLGRLDGLREHPFQARLADAFGPARQRTGIDRRTGAEPDFAAEQLPIRVIDPATHYILVRQREGVLQVWQAGDHPGATAERPREEGK